MSDYETAEPWCPEPPPEDERTTPRCLACHRGWHHDCHGCGCPCNTDEPDHENAPAAQPVARGPGTRREP